MNKTFKWSVLLSIVIGIVWIFMPESLKMSPILKFMFFNHDISSSLSFSRYWDLVIFITLPFSVAILIKDDGYFDLGVIVISVASALIAFATFDQVSLRVFQPVVFVLAVLISGMAIVGLPTLDRPKVIFKRLLATLLTVIIVNTLIFGIWNGVVIGGYFLMSFIVIVIVAIIAGFLWDVAKKTPNAFKTFFAWMNK